MTSSTMPTPELFFQTAFSYQRTAALKAAVDLDVFTAIAEGATTTAELAMRCNGSERGIRILCDFLTISGLLTKSGNQYQLTPDSAVFLVKTSQAYLGGTLAFLASSVVSRNFERLAETIRRGTVADVNTVAGEEQEHWVDFARAMAPMMMPAAIGIADILEIEKAGPVRILDIAAGHGIFGLTLARRNAQAEVVAVDWPGVLAVAEENAAKMGLKDRLRTIPGDAFKVDYGTGYEIALLTNFLHHFDIPTCTSLMRKVGAALKPGGKAVILEFVPNEDRISPPMAASFSIVMLAGTPAGDAYTSAQFRGIIENAGFKTMTTHSLPMPETVVIATKS